MAQNISAGLRAIDGFEKLWSFTEPADKAALAREVLSNLYRDRSAYARSIRWTFSPDAELWDHVGGQRSALAADVLKTRHGLNEHQLALAAQAVELRRADVAIRQEAAKFAAQDVQIRTESVSQQQVVTDMLKEFLEHLRTWRKLADTGKKLLWVTTLLSFGALAAILVMAWEDKLDDWAVPVVVFALALFAISPAVLLILGRPLKGLDEWKPGNTSSQPDSPESGSSQGETPSSDAASSTVAYGETNQPKAYGPTGRLRT